MTEERKKGKRKKEKGKKNFGVSSKPSGVVSSAEVIVLSDYRGPWRWLSHKIDLQYPYSVKGSVTLFQLFDGSSN